MTLMSLFVTGSACHEKLMVPGLPGGTKPGAGRIGRQIADEMLESSRLVIFQNVKFKKFNKFNKCPFVKWQPIEFC